MGLRYQHYKIATCLAIALLCPLAQAAVPPLAPLKLHARYRVTWGGLTLGRINVDIDEDALSYHGVVDTKTSGFAKLFSDERTVGEVHGHRTPDGAYVPGTYTSRRSKGDSGSTTLEYDADGKLLKRTREPDDDPAWRPPVPPEQANTATDPMTGGLILRKRVHDHMAQEVRDTLLRTYDGARLGEFHARVVSPARVEIGERFRDAINLVVTRQPIAGYTPKELKKYAAGDPIIHLYLSADADMIPLKLSIGTSFGEVDATLVPPEGS